LVKKSLFIVIILCFTTSLYAKGSSEGNLDKGIDTQASYLLDKIPQNSIIAIVGISSGSENFSRYITEGLTSYIMNNKKSNIKIVERAAMPILQRELRFQYSGAVDDNFMVSLGKTVGANTVITGTIYSINNDLRFNIRAIDIETSNIITSNGIDFTADKKVKSLLNGGTVKDTLNRDNIPIRKEDGSISKANKELKEQQKQTMDNTASFFSTVFYDREPRVLLGYNYFPDFPLSIEGGYLKNGLGFYAGLGCDPSGFKEDFQRTIGEPYGVFNFYFGLTYPLYFNWLWITGGFEMCVTQTATSYTKYVTMDGGYYDIDEKMNFNPSIGIYFSLIRFYLTAKYRYCSYANGFHSFMLGIGLGL